MACGDKYRYLLRTASGTDAEHPCSLFCNERDYSDWHKTIEKLGAIVNERWALLRRIELAQGKGTVQSDAVRDSAAAYHAAMAELLPPWWSMATVLPAQKVSQALAVGELGLCVLEEIDDGAAALGEALPDVKAPQAPQVSPPTLIGGLQTVVMVGFVGLLAYGTARAAITARAKARTVERTVEG